MQPVKGRVYILHASMAVCVHVCMYSACSFCADLYPLRTLCGVHVQQVNNGHVHSALCMDEDDGCEQSDIMSSKNSSHKGHFYLPIKENEVLLIDPMSSEDELHSLLDMGCSDVTESGLRRKKSRLTKQQRWHKKWGKCAVPSTDHTAHSISTTVDTSPLLTHSRRRVSHETVEQSKKEDVVNGRQSKDSDSSLLVNHKCTLEEEDEMELCGSDQNTLELIVSLPLRDVEHKTIGESSDQSSSHTGVHREGWGMQCAGGGEGHSLNQEAPDEEVNNLPILYLNVPFNTTRTCPRTLHQILIRLGGHLQAYAT